MTHALRPTHRLMLIVTVALVAGAVRASAQRPPMHDMMTLEDPIEPLDNVWIEELTMVEIRDLLRSGTNTALILTGGIEENGPYLTTGKHNHVLRVMGEAIARKLGNTLVAPIVTIEPGNPERASTPGGIRYSQETYRAVLRDYATSLKAQGFTRIFYLGDSGGNARGMAAVAEELATAWADEDVIVAHIPEYYNYGDVLTYQREVLGVDETQYADGFHDNYYITTIIMNDDPQHVRLEQRIKAGKTTTNGFGIVPIGKALAHGRRLVEFRADVTVDAIRKVIAAHRR